jgi:hypothetical protein
MDVQTISGWIKAVLSNPAAPGWTQAVILLITAYIVWRYTKETQRLREEAQRQTELQMRPFVVLEATHDDLQVKNLGNSTAINIRVEDIKLTKPNEASSIIVNFPEPVPALLRGECIPIRQKKLLANGEAVQGSSADSWIGILKPLRTQIAKPTEINFRPEITIEFQNVEGQRYFVKERLIYGELEIIDSGPQNQGKGRS